MFRWPKDKLSNSVYYESRYEEFPATVLPPKNELDKLKVSNFKGSAYDISEKILLVKKYVEKGIVIDFGASWGYGIWQFAKEGFSGLGYDISVARAEFGEKNLGVKIVHCRGELSGLEGNFDVIFANNVLEHIGEIREVFDYFYRLLKNGGYLFIFVPDCSEIEYGKWKGKYAFGQKHCIAFSKDFFYKNLLRLGFHLVEIKESQTDKCELIVIVKKA